MFRRGHGQHWLLSTKKIQFRNQTDETETQCRARDAAARISFTPV
jgi:hypothetical protein